MRIYSIHIRLICCLIITFNLCAAFTEAAQTTSPLPQKFNLNASGLELDRHSEVGSFFDVVGRKSAVFGYENRPFEAWVYPMKLLDDFTLSFRLEGYPLDIYGPDIMTGITVRPEATIFTYSHAAFTVRQIIFAPIEEPGIVMLLDVKSVLPMTITGAFRPKLRLMWPAGLMTGYIGWDETSHTYTISEETNRFAGVIGSPLARDISVMPYQEEPRDVPNRFVIEASLDVMKASLIPIIIAGSVEGRDKAKAAYESMLASIRPLYEKNVTYYRRLLDETANITTPDDRLTRAFAWAKVGVDKGIATNPMLGTGLLAGFRTSGESERPGFAWFFGRDALWTSFAVTSYGDFASTRQALDFLKQFQREDGKIPHEISQSAGLLPWFKDYGYPWASADATPLYIIAHGDYWRSSGDLDFIKKNWDSILKAYRFTSATDTDNNGLIENTKFGHGWVEGGALYPPHEEIYMQGVWMEALERLAEMADAIKDAPLAQRARAEAERTRKATEQTYWLADQGYYAFATNLPRAESRTAEPGPNREIRQQRINELDRKRLIDEDTVLPAVPLWWHTLEDGRAQSEIDHLGSGEMATDWGARIISNRSRLYDPLSYHYGSVWALFTGWTSVGAYRYGRPHVGYQALTANALLTYQGALGYVTELLSGDFNTAFGRSSHHQIWSEAMVVTPLMRGLLGIEARDAGKTLIFAPQLPANWSGLTARKIAAGVSHYDLTLKNLRGRMEILAERDQPREQNPQGGANRLIVSPAFPLDAEVRSVIVNGRAMKFQIARTGDVQRAEVIIENAGPRTEIVYVYDEGTDVFIEPEVPAPGASNSGLRLLRSHADKDALYLTAEGLGGHAYTIGIRTGRDFGETEGVKKSPTNTAQLILSFEGPGDRYVRREFVIPLLSKK